MPKMTHPESKQVIDVAPAQVDLYKSQGWQVKASAKK
jgi:hypothetical protein